jgi:hypothetical protein
VADGDRAGVGDQADALVQTEGGDKEFRVVDDGPGHVEQSAQLPVDEGVLPRGLAAVRPDGDRGHGGDGMAGQRLVDEIDEPARGAAGVVWPPAAARAYEVGDDVSSGAGAENGSWRHSRRDRRRVLWSPARVLFRDAAAGCVLRTAGETMAGSNKTGGGGGRVLVGRSRDGPRVDGDGRDITTGTSLGS